MCALLCGNSVVLLHPPPTSSEQQIWANRAAACPPSPKNPTMLLPLQPFQPVSKKHRRKPVVFHLFLTWLWMKAFQSCIPFVVLDILPDHLKDSNERNKTQRAMRLSVYPSIKLSVSPFLFCYVVNTGNHIPEINPALGRPATTVCNVITQTQQFIASTMQKTSFGKTTASAWMYKNGNMKILQAIATQENIIPGETLSRLDPSNTQSIPCGACKWAHRDVSMDWKLWVRAQSHTSAGPACECVFMCMWRGCPCV